MLDADVQKSVRAELLACSNGLTTLPRPDGEAEEEIELALDPEDLDYEGIAEPFVRAHGRGLQGDQAAHTESDTIHVEVDHSPAAMPAPTDDGKAVLAYPGSMAVKGHACGITTCSVGVQHAVGVPLAQCRAL